jgi:methyl-accepting chemotaxis protein
MFILMLFIAITGYRTSGLIADSMDRMYDEFATPAILMAQAQGLTAQNRRMLLTLTLTRDESVRSDYEGQILENRKTILDYITRYEQTHLSPEETTLLNQLNSGRADLDKRQDEIFDMSRDPSQENAVRTRLSTGGDLAEVSEKYNEMFDKLVQLLVRLCDEMDEDAAAAAKDGERIIVISSVVAILLGSIFGGMVSRLITNPVKKMQSSVKLFSEGDLMNEFATTGRDELAQMGRGLQDMADNLKNIISSVKDASSGINETAHEFSVLAEETNATVEEFRSNVEEMGTNLNSLASTGEEVNASVEEVAAGAQATAEKGTDIARQVDEAMSAGQNGVEAVRRVVTGIDGVAKNASDAAQSIQELGTRTRQIQSFVAQIGGIADQTNLLALNAAIEAARAGEAGRGFAVVAEEVRKLAEDSNVAAKSIAELAETITGDLDNVVGISLGNAKASQNAKELSSETEEIIGRMISYLRSISGATQDLAAVSQEQAASSEEIAEAIQNIATRVNSTAEAGEHIRSGVMDVASAAEKMAQGADGLSNLSNELRELLTFFKMEELARSGAQAGRIKVLPARR